MTKTEKRPKTPPITMRGATYSQLRDEAKRRGITVSTLMEQIVDNFFKGQGANGK